MADTDPNSHKGYSNQHVVVSHISCSSIDDIRSKFLFVMRNRIISHALIVTLMFFSIYSHSTGQRVFFILYNSFIIQPPRKYIDLV